MTLVLLRPTLLIPKMTGGQPLVFRDSFYLWMWNMREEMYDDCVVDLCVSLSLKEVARMVTLYFNHISVRMFCPPSMLISTTPVSWWAPGIPGMENKTRLVGLYNTHNISVLHGLHSLQVSRLFTMHIHIQLCYAHLYLKASIMHLHIHIEFRFNPHIQRNQCCLESFYK